MSQVVMKSSESSPPSQQSSPKRWKLFSSIGVLLLGIAGTILWRGASPSLTSASVQMPVETHLAASPPAEDLSHQVEQAPVAAAEAPPRERLIGHWRLNQSIVREIQIRQDGTAVMECTLDTLSSLIYGRKLTLDLNWTFEDGVLTHIVIGGSPQANVSRLTDAFGDTRSYRLVSVDKDRMVLQGPLDSKGVENWVAVPPPSETDQK